MTRLAETGIPVREDRAVRRQRARSVVVWLAGIAGLAAYNWWLLVPLRPGLLQSPNEFFSNLEVSGQPFASLMQHADAASGLLLLAAFLIAGAGGLRTARRESLAMMVFAAAGAAGGIFPEQCADGLSVMCRRLEWSFGLPLPDYFHALAGIAEFAGITLALMFAVRRTSGSTEATARIYRTLAKSAIVAYPLLGLCYLLNQGGAVMEGMFFTGFTLMVIIQLAERTETRLPITIPRPRQSGD